MHQGDGPSQLADAAVFHQNALTFHSIDFGCVSADALQVAATFTFRVVAFVDVLVAHERQYVFRVLALIPDFHEMLNVILVELRGQSAGLH